MYFGKLGPIQGHATVATCRPSGSGRDNESFKEPISGARAGPPTQPKISFMNLSPSKRSSEGNSAENKNSCNLAVGVEKDRASSSSSFVKCKAMNTENIDSDPPSEGKIVHNIGYKSNLLGSL